MRGKEKERYDSLWFQEMSHRRTFITCTETEREARKGMMMTAYYCKREWGPRRLGLRPRPRGGFAANMLLGTPPQTPLGSAPDPAEGSRPQTPC